MLADIGHGPVAFAESTKREDGPAAHYVRCRTDDRHRRVSNAAHGGQRASAASFDDRELDHPIEPGTDMKYILLLSIIAASLASCAIVPAGYGDSRDRYYYNHDGYDRDRGYSRGDDNYRNRNYSRGDGSYRDYSYRDDRGNQYPYREHGS
jgi:hypothetical protein